MNNVERFYASNGNLMAILVRHQQREDKPDHYIEFYTHHEHPLQVGSMRVPAGKIITPHYHPHMLRRIATTSEVLFLKSGQLKVDLIDGFEIQSLTMGSGDVIILLEGGHGFEALTDVLIWEIKQGPYAGDKDKVRLEDVQVRLRQGTIIQKSK